MQEAPKKDEKVEEEADSQPFVEHWCNTELSHEITLLAMPLPKWCKRLPRRMRKLKRRLLLQRQRDFPMGAAVVSEFFKKGFDWELSHKATLLAMLLK